MSLQKLVERATSEDLLSADESLHDAVVQQALSKSDG